MPSSRNGLGVASWVEGFRESGRPARGAGVRPRPRGGRRANRRSGLPVPGREPSAVRDRRWWAVALLIGGTQLLLVTAAAWAVGELTQKARPGRLHLGDRERRRVRGRQGARRRRIESRSARTARAPTSRPTRSRAAPWRCFDRVRGRHADPEAGPGGLHLGDRERGRVRGRDERSSGATSVAVSPDGASVYVASVAQRCGGGLRPRRRRHADPEARHGRLHLGDRERRRLRRRDGARRRPLGDRQPRRPERLRRVASTASGGGVRSRRRRRR